MLSSGAGLGRAGCALESSLRWERRTRARLSTTSARSQANRVMWRESVSRICMCMHACWHRGIWMTGKQCLVFPKYRNGLEQVWLRERVRSF